MTMWSSLWSTSVPDSGVTAQSIGDLINGATSKSTPVDADQIGLMDSAASNILKKLSWANLKTTIGAATLVNGKVPAEQLPSYVDDAVEYASLAGFPETGETGIIYIALDTNKIYRWTGTTYIEISPHIGPTTQVVGDLINSATTKDTPVDADQIGLMDSAASNILKKLSWANLKATLKSYFDTLYGNGTLELTQNAKTDNYTCILSDSGKHISISVASKTITLPANSSVAYPVGTMITFFANGVATSIAITTDTMTLANTVTTGTRTLASNGVATALKISATSWIISGIGLT